MTVESQTCFTCTFVLHHLQTYAFLYTNKTSDMGQIWFYSYIIRHLEVTVWLNPQCGSAFPQDLCVQHHSHLFFTRPETSQNYFNYFYSKLLIRAFSNSVFI